MNKIPPMYLFIGGLFVLMMSFSFRETTGNPRGSNTLFGFLFGFGFVMSLLALGKQFKNREN